MRARKSNLEENEMAHRTISKALISEKIGKLTTHFKKETNFNPV